MTTYSTNFSGYTADVAPSDWTARWVTASNTWAVRSKASVEGGKTLENTGTVDGRHLLSWNTVDADSGRADAEVLARMRSSSTGAGQLRLTVRGSGAAAAESGYSVEICTTAAADMRVSKLVSGTQTLLSPLHAFAFAANTWYYVRFRVNGTSLKAKVWADGTEEPTSWQIEITDSSISAAGWIGASNVESTGTRDWDWFSIGTAGDTAPLTTSTATSVRAHQDVMEVCLATVASARVQQDVLEVAFGESVLGYIHQSVLEVAISQEVATVTQQPRMIVIM